MQKFNTRLQATRIGNRFLWWVFAAKPYPSVVQKGARGRPEKSMYLWEKNAHPGQRCAGRAISLLERNIPKTLSSVPPLFGPQNSEPLHPGFGLPPSGGGTVEGLHPALSSTADTYCPPYQSPPTGRTQAVAAVGCIVLIMIPTANVHRAFGKDKPHHIHPTLYWHRFRGQVMQMKFGLYAVFPATRSVFQPSLADLLSAEDSPTVIYEWANAVHFWGPGARIKDCSGISEEQKDHPGAGGLEGNHSEVAEDTKSRHDGTSDPDEKRRDPQNDKIPLERDPQNDMT